MPVGIGFDVHRLRPGRRLRLGGIDLPSRREAVGHSDGDVVLHAVCDAVLGAAGAGDIGEHFPDTDPRWRGVDSSVFVRHAVGLARRRRLAVENVDLVILAEAPKLGSRKKAMAAAIARLLGVRPGVVNVKAKTMEGLGPVGAGRALAAWALVSLKKKAVRR